MNHKVALVILDGWGIAQDKSVSAIDHAKTPFIDGLKSTYPMSKLSTSGLDVGLPAGQMGNSEVGHMNLGAGRVVYQDLVKVNLAIEDGSFFSQPALIDAFKHAKSSGKKVHFIGLVSDGGVHAHINHLIALCKMADEYGLEDVFIHAFTDGRDCDPKSGKAFITKLLNETRNLSAQLASVIGRYYAMDRDNRWERIAKAYELLVNRSGIQTNAIIQAIDSSYKQNVTDEFLEAHAIHVEGESRPAIEAGDVVVNFNFRTDRGRQLSMALTQRDFPDHNMQKLNLHYVTMTKYDASFEGVHIVYEKDNLRNTLGEVLEKAGKKQIRIAETEKYPHVTFFFSGGQETPFKGEKRHLIPSPKVATYDLQPEMSAEEITTTILPHLVTQEPDFICLNYANADMVGHTGDFDAAIKACETVDRCTKQLVECGLENGYTFIIIADHGNSDLMINSDGSPNTAHTTNPVPCYLVGVDIPMDISDGKLGDIAPTILKLMRIKVPQEMTGNILIKS